MAIEPNWPVLLPSSEIGVAFAMEALREWRAHDRFAAYCFLGSSLAALAIAGTLGSGRGIAIPLQIGPPSPIRFAMFAVTISALATGLHRYGDYRERVLLKKSALELAERLDDFAQICAARIGEPFSLPRAEKEIRERAAYDEYLTTFGTEIRRVHRVLTVNDQVFANLLKSMLGSAGDRDLRLPGLATWVAKTLRTEITLLKPRPWIDLRVLAIFGAYMGLALALWLALFEWAHK